MRIALAIILALTLAGCGAEATPGSSATATAGAGETTSTPGSSGTATAGAADTTATAPATSATAGEATGATSTPPSEATTAPAGNQPAPDSLEAKAAQALAQKLDVGADRLQLTANEPQEWSDSSLGCPAPDMMYLQVITPGFKLTFSDGAKTYDVHTDERGTRFVLCENKQPANLGGS